MPEPAYNAVAVDGITDRLADDEPDSWAGGNAGLASCMNDEVGLSDSNALLNGGAELR